MRPRKNKLIFSSDFVAAFLGSQESAPLHNLVFQIVQGGQLTIECGC